MNSADSASIFLPLCLTEHQEQVQAHLTGLQLYHTQQILPLLLLDVPPRKRNYTTDLRVGSIVAFYKSGSKKVLKNEKKKLGRILKIHTSADSHFRKVDIVYYNSSQLQLIDGKLVGSQPVYK